MNPRVRSLVAPAIATLAMGAFLTGLGIWQLHRLAWKEGLIAEIEARVHAAPVPVPPPADWAALRPKDYEYRHVTLDGTFDNAEETLVFRRPRMAQATSSRPRSRSTAAAPSSSTAAGCRTA